MRELEHERSVAITLSARTQAIRQIKRLCDEVARPFDEPAAMRVEKSLRYIPDAAEIAANPTNPVTWARVLLEKPLHAMISWYRLRPVAKLVSGARTVGALEHYDRLLTKHFGEELSRRTLDQQQARRQQGS
jgi:hypothetical protein